ncbi:MAG TPA: cysteine synthase A [Candidatus Acidoferrales bacterium]|nr:cysteine synthase A [Candidatus Acidoferrales bacterium]
MHAHFDARRGFSGTVGHTPHIVLEKLSAHIGRTIVGKAEFLNPGGSVKDRAALGIIDDAERSGRLTPGGTIVEGTAGNTGIAIALLAASRGYRAIIAIPDDQSAEKIAMLRIFGADVRVVKSVPFTNDQNYYHVARRIAEQTPNSIWADQFNNTANRKIHEATTGVEIWDAFGTSLSAFVTASGTGGTLGGVSRALKARNPSVKTVAADPMGSSIYSYVKTGELASEGDSEVEGIGIKRITDNFKDTPLDDAVRVEDRAWIAMSQWLVHNEGLYVGGSAALNVVAAARYARTLPKDSIVCTILCDGGERYRSKLYDGAWLAQQGYMPEVSALDLL